MHRIFPGAGEPHILAALGLGLLVGSVAMAQPSGPPEPPPEAYEACEDLAEGDSCEVTFGDHTVTGSCSTHPGSNELACRPEGGPGGGHHGPPPEAYDACADAELDSACVVSTPHGDLEGSCLEDREDSSLLLCVPDNMPEPPEGAR